MWAIFLLAAIGEPGPSTPNEVFEAAVIDLASLKVSPADRGWIRYLSVWPSSPSELESLSAAASFWANSLSWGPELVPISLTADGTLIRIDLRRFGWSKESWEKLAAADPYFAVTTRAKDGTLIRGWIDPKTEAALRASTGSTRAVLRADWFLARTSLDGQQGFFQQGFYSEFLGLPKTESELLATLHAEEKIAIQSSAVFNAIFLLKGGAVQDSIVAQHNRGLETMATPIGPAGSRFIWRSLDTDSNAGDASVFTSLAGSLKVAGKEHIYSLPNGLHGYFAVNGKGERVSEVPEKIAQDKTHPHDSIVYLGWKCVRCHGAQGINGFDDVIRRLMVNKKTAVAVIGKGYEQDPALRAKLDAYYKSDLALEIESHRKSYAVAVKSATGMEPAENTKNYLGWVERYLWGRIDLLTAQNESGLGDETERYITLTSPSPLVPLLAGETISRELWEANYGRLMTAKIHEWETGDAVVERHPVGVGDLGGRAGGDASVGGGGLPDDAVLLPVPDGYPPGAVLFRSAGAEHLRYRDGRHWIRSGDQWERVGR